MIMTPSGVKSTQMSCISYSCSEGPTKISSNEFSNNFAMVCLLVGGDNPRAFAKSGKGNINNRTLYHNPQIPNL